MAMRLRTPNVTGVVSKSGKAALHYKGLWMHPDGGATYALEIAWPERETGKFVIEIVVGSNNSTRVSEAAKAAGLNYDEMPLPKQGAFREKFVQENGKYDRVKEFYAEGILEYHSQAIITLRDMFIELYFELESSYRFNNEDGDDGSSRYYDDTLDFHPIPLPEQYWKTYRSLDVMGKR
jgi:hypothetical protein